MLLGNTIMGAFGGVLDWSTEHLPFKTSQVTIKASIRRVDFTAHPENTAIAFQGTGRVDIRTHPYTTAACASGNVTKTTDRDSSRYTYNGIRRMRQLALGCESN